MGTIIRRSFRLQPRRIGAGCKEFNDRSNRSLRCVRQGAWHAEGLGLLGFHRIRRMAGMVLASQGSVTPARNL